MEGSSSSSKKWAPATVNDAPPLDYAQTKGEDIELWAIRVPPGFDASQLDGLVVGALSCRAARACTPVAGAAGTVGATGVVGVGVGERGGLGLRLPAIAAAV